MSSTNRYTGQVATLPRPGYAEVELSEAPSCTGCALAGGCGSRPSGRRVEAAVPAGMHLQAGDRVEVVCPPSSSQRAMRWGIVYPCLVLVVTSIVLNLCSLPDGAIALWSLVAVTVYYTLLFLLRRLISGRLEWRVTRQL